MKHQEFFTMRIGLTLILVSDVCNLGVMAFSFQRVGSSFCHLRKRLHFDSKKSSLQSTTDAKFRFSSNTGEDSEYSFFDEVSIYVRAGSGGQGASTYKKAKKGQNGIPDGGSGGPGGNIVFEVDASLNTLASFSPSSGGGSINDNNANNIKSNMSNRLRSFRAETGLPGGRMYDNGRKGQDCIVRVPPGTIVCREHEPASDEDNNDDDTSEEIEDTQNLPTEALIGDINADAYSSYVQSEIGTLTLDIQPSLVVARGGYGGEGTASLKGKKKGATRRGPQGGERFRLRLTLKIVADVALVGVPNAGKSTFLSAVTRAEPKIANYPFTTVVPNLGVWIPPTSESFASDEKGKSRGGDKAAGSTGIVLCDVPGLIEGAADGVGLGHAFLRHVERCRVILHILDGTSEFPVDDYEMVNKELKRYGTGSLASKPQVVVVNKIDAWEEASTEQYAQRKKELEENLKASMSHTRIMWVSAKERKNMDELMVRMASYVGNLKDTDESLAAKSKQNS